MDRDTYRYVLLHERTRDATVEQGCKAYDVELVTNHEGRQPQRQELGQVRSLLVAGRSGGTSKRWRYSTAPRVIGAMTHERSTALADLLCRVVRPIGRQEARQLASEAAYGVKR